MKFAKSLAILALMFGILAGFPAMAQSPAEADCSVLYTGQATEVGSVCVTINADDVNLDYFLIDDWTLAEAQAWIGDNLGNLPQSIDGTPQLSLFPHQATNIGGLGQYSFTIPFSELAVNADTFCNAEVFVAAHATITRTVAGTDDEEEASSGKSDKSKKSHKSKKSGKSDKADNHKADKSAKSAKSKSGKNDKSAKNGKSGKSDKSGKNDNKSKNSNQASSSAKGKTANASSSSDNQKAGKSGKSNKSSKSGKSHHNGNNGNGHHDHGNGHGYGHHHGDNDGGSSTGPITQTESVWAGTTLINDGSSASYFSFTNDFCPEPEPEPEPPLVVVPQGCYNTFAVGEAAFSPVGITDGAQAWVNTLDTAIGSFGTGASNGVSDDGFIVAAILPDGGLEVHLLFNSNMKIHSANVYAGEFGSFTNMSPLQFGHSAAGNNTPLQMLSIPAPALGPLMDIVIHAVVCKVTGPV